MTTMLMLMLIHEKGGLHLATHSCISSFGKLGGGSRDFWRSSMSGAFFRAYLVPKSIPFSGIAIGDGESD